MVERVAVVIHEVEVTDGGEDKVHDLFPESTYIGALVLRQLFQLLLQTRAI